MSIGTLFLEHTLDFICRVHPLHQLTYLSQAGADYLDDSGAQSVLSLILKDDHPHYLKAFNEAQEATSARCEVRLTQDGRTSWVELTLIRLPAGEQTAICAKDISKWKNYETALEHAAEHDTLTGLANRARVARLVTAMINSSQHTGKGFAFLVLDLDGFKKVNESLGHSAGDEVLVATARRLVGCVRESDLVARLGGDEFVIVLQGISSREQFEPLASKILSTIEKPFIAADGSSMHLSTSVGVCFHPEQAQTFETLLRNADSTMYKAKDLGRNQVAYFASQGEIRNILTLESALYLGIQDGEFHLKFQPQFRPDGTTVVGAEALMRWNSQQFGEVSPELFIPLAEKNGLIEFLGKWALRSACHLLVGINQFAPRFSVSVNVSTRQLESKQFLTYLSHVLEETGVNPHNLILEITETLLMQNPAEVKELLERIVGLGVKLSVDDFGTGYSSLSYLSKFPLSSLKVDKSFMVDIFNSKPNQHIVAAITGLARDLEMYAVVEGIETREQLDFVVGKGCNVIQGFIFSRPVRVGCLIDNLKQQVWMSE